MRKSPAAMPGFFVADQEPELEPHRQLYHHASASRAGRGHMAKKKRKYSKSASKDVESEMKRFEKGTARSGPGGKGGKVKSRKQAIAIGLSKARKKGKKVPRKKRV
jgi:hypothetical protein